MINTIGMIGTGNMGSAILRGIVEAEYVKASMIVAYDTSSRRMNELKEDIPEQTSFENTISDKVQAEQIHRILHELPDPYKEVFMLKVFGELGFKEIAKLFGKSESWAKMTYYRAKAKIAEKLEASK